MDSRTALTAPASTPAQKTRTVRLRRLLTLLSALGLLPVALIGAWAINTAIDNQARETERSMLGLARALASAVDAELDVTISTLRTMSYSPALVSRDIPAFYAIASETARSRPDWSAVTLRDKGGRLIFSTELPLGTDSGETVDPDSLRRAMTGLEPVVGHITRTRSQRLDIPVRMPVIHQGEIAFVLTAMIRPDRILEIVTRQKIPDSWVISVHDATMTRVARSKDHARTVGTGITTSLAALLQAGELEGTGVSFTLDGIEAITAFTRIPSHGWVIAIGSPASHLKNTLVRSFAIYIGTIAISLAIYISLAAFISRRIVSAINSLQDKAVRLGQGQPVQTVPNLIEEVNQTELALQAASEKRIAAEKEREALMTSLNTAMDSLRAALSAAEEAGRAKDNFLAVLSHELRNPLAPIVNALDLLDAKEDHASIRERQIMRRQANHMKRLIDDLLDISRITQGKLEMRKDIVNLASVVRQAIEAVRPAVKAHGNDIEVSLPGDAWVEGDETRLVQMVTNLLTNSLRFGQDGRIHVSLAVAAQRACITVRDEGAGINPETAQQLFTPFFQGPQPLARPTGGLGLGLAIVKGIVEAHNGDISVSSPGVGKGSTFEVWLPAAASPTGRDIPPPLPAGSRGARILVVDDNEDAAETLTEILQLAGHSVRTAYDGNTALALASSFIPDVVILDIGLPDIDGFTLAGMIRARLPGWNGKLIALSGYGQENDKSKASMAGFDIHLTKPVNRDELLRLLCQPG